MVGSALWAEAGAIRFADRILGFVHDQVLANGVCDIEVMRLINEQVFDGVALRHLAARGDIDDRVELFVE